MTQDPTQTSKPQKAKVIAVGPDVTSLKVGDFVLFNQYGSDEVNEDELIVQESEILGTWTE